MPIDWIQERMALMCSAGESACEGGNTVTKAVIPHESAEVNQDSQVHRQPLMKSDLQDTDIGYSSHGTQDDSSQQSRLTEWQEYNQEECMHGEDDMDDLLYHFNNFFKAKLDTELDSFQESMKNILREQQIHVRQIVHSTISSVNGQQDMNSPHPQMETCDVEINDQIQPPLDQDNPSHDRSLQQFTEETNFHLLTELLSLSCAITAILHDQKYRT